MNIYQRGHHTALRMLKNTAHHIKLSVMANIGSMMIRVKSTMRRKLNFWSLG